MYKNKSLKVGVVIFIGALIILIGVTLQTQSPQVALENEMPVSYPILDSSSVAIAGVQTQSSTAEETVVSEEPAPQPNTTQPQETITSQPDTTDSTYKRPPFARITKPSAGMIASENHSSDGSRTLNFNTLLVFTNGHIYYGSEGDPSLIKWFIESPSLPRTFFTQGNDIKTSSYKVPASACGDTSFKIIVVVTDNGNGLTAEDSITESGFDVICPQPVNTPPTLEVFAPTVGQTYYNVPEAYPYEMYPRHCPYYVDIYLSGRITDPIKGQLPDNELYWYINGGSESAYGNNFNYRFCGLWYSPQTYTVVLSYSTTPTSFVTESVPITILPLK